MCITGFSIMRWATNPNIRYMGVFFITLGAFPGGPGFLSWGLNNAAGPAVRAVSSAYIVTLGTAGGVLATWYVDCLRFIYLDANATTGHTGAPNNLNTLLATQSISQGKLASAFLHLAVSHTANGRIGSVIWARGIIA